MTEEEAKMSNLGGLRRQIIQMATDAGEGHIASALSVLEIIWALYDQVMVRGSNDDYRDRFILSKGHGCLALYTVLAAKGYFPQEQLSRFCRPRSTLLGHPDRRLPGVECATGSLGHGFPMALGMAFGLKIRKSPARVYCVVGDGECQEGTIWETAALAAHHKLSNLTLIIDQNHSADRAVEPLSFGMKFEAFGWRAEVISGHGSHNIIEACRIRDDKPVCIVAETVKGYGVPMIEADPNAWHHRAPNAEELRVMLGGLE